MLAWLFQAWIFWWHGMNILISYCAAEFATSSSYFTTKKFQTRQNQSITFYKVPQDHTTTYYIYKYSIRGNHPVALYNVPTQYWTMYPCSMHHRSIMILLLPFFHAVFPCSQTRPKEGNLRPQSQHYETRRWFVYANLQRYC